MCLWHHWPLVLIFHRMVFPPLSIVFRLPLCRSAVLALRLLSRLFFRLLAFFLAFSPSRLLAFFLAFFLGFFLWLLSLASFPFLALGSAALADASFRKFPLYAIYNHMITYLYIYIYIYMFLGRAKETTLSST